MEPTDGRQDSMSQPLKVTTAGAEAPQSAAADNEYPLVARLTKGLGDCDWDQLQERYAEAMEEHGQVEENLRAETAKLLEVVLQGCWTCFSAMPF